MRALGRLNGNGREAIGQAFVVWTAAGSCFFSRLICLTSMKIAKAPIYSIEHRMKKDPPTKVLVSKLVLFNPFDSNR
jgi:hypothetical protein